VNAALFFSFHFNQHFTVFTGHRGRRRVPWVARWQLPTGSPILTRLIFHCFCSAPTCHRQTDGRNWSSKRWHCTLKCIGCQKLFDSLTYRHGPGCVARFGLLMQREREEIYMMTTDGGGRWRRAWFSEKGVMARTVEPTAASSWWIVKNRPKYLALPQLTTKLMCLSLILTCI